MQPQGTKGRRESTEDTCTGGVTSVWGAVGGLSAIRWKENF